MPPPDFQVPVESSGEGAVGAVPLAWWQQRTLRLVLSVGLVLFFLALFAWYTSLHWDEFSQLRVVSVVPLIAVAILFLGSVTLRGLLSLVVLRAFAVHLTLAESFKLSAATTMSNFLLPLRSGAALRAVYLKRIHDFPYTYFLSTMAALFVFIGFVHSAVGLATVVWIGLRRDVVSWPLIGFLAVICLASGATIFLAPLIEKIVGPWSARVAEISVGWTRIVSSKSLLGAALLVSLGDTLFGAAGFYAALTAFSLPRDVAGSLLLTSSQQVGSLASLTPGALGFQELVGLFFATVIPITMVQALSVLASVRVIKTAVIVVVGLPSLLALAKKGTQ